VSDPHFLYRCYDADDRLLYIGCTAWPSGRITQHRQDRRNKASRWLQVSMTRYEVEGPFPSLHAGLLAEDRAIAAEQPLFNRQGRRIPGWQVVPRVAEYLISIGQRDLAIETACTCWAEFSDLGEIDPSCAAHIAERRELTEIEMAVIFS
jgi:hypothetical protein